MVPDSDLRYDESVKSLVAIVALVVVAAGAYMAIGASDAGADTGVVGPQGRARLSTGTSTRM